MSDRDYSLSELCISACAESFRGDGEILASGMGLIPRLAVGLAKLSFSPDLLLNDAECTLVSEPIPPGPRTAPLAVEGWLGFWLRTVFLMFVPAPAVSLKNGRVGVGAVELGLGWSS